MYHNYLQGVSLVWIQTDCLEGGGDCHHVWINIILILEKKYHTRSIVITLIVRLSQYPSTQHHYYILRVCSLHLRWDYFPEQFSPQFYLEAGQYYYFEMVSNQGLGPWNIGLAAKVHSLNHTSYPYQGDRERQRINITSSVVMETVVSNSVCMWC